MLSIPGRFGIPNLTGTWVYRNRIGDLILKCTGVSKWDGSTVNGARVRRASSTATTKTAYAGVWVRGQFVGHAVIQYRDGSEYTGNVKNYEPSGYGKYTGSDGVIYECNWANGYPNGQGTLTYPHLGVFRIEFTNGQVTKMIPNEPKTPEFMRLMHQADSNHYQCRPFPSAGGVWMVLEKEQSGEANPQIIEMLQNPKYIKELSTPEKIKNYIDAMDSDPNKPHLLITYVGPHTICVVFKRDQAIICNGGFGARLATHDNKRRLKHFVTSTLFSTGQTFKVLKLTENVNNAKRKILGTLYNATGNEASSLSFEQLYLRTASFTGVVSGGTGLEKRSYPLHTGQNCWYQSVKLATEAARPRRPRPEYSQHWIRALSAAAAAAAAAATIATKAVIDQNRDRSRSF